MIEQMIPDLARLLGVEPATALLVFGLFVTAANLVGRLIPDDKTGALGVIRRTAKLIGMYAPNKVHSKESNPEEVEAGAPTPAVVMAFPGLANHVTSVDDIIAETAEKLRD